MVVCFPLRIATLYLTILLLFSIFTDFFPVKDNVALNMLLSVSNDFFWKGFQDWIGWKIMGLGKATEFYL